MMLPTTISLLLWLGVFSIANAGQSVLLVLSQQSPPYQQLVSTLQQRLSPSLWTLQTVSVENYNPSSVQADLIIPVGTRATSRVLRDRLLWPVLSVLIPRQSFESLRQQKIPLIHSQQQMLSAIYLEQPMQRQLQLAALIDPSIKRVGVVLGPSSHDQAAAISAAINERDWQAELVRFEREDNPIERIGPLSARVDALLAIPDRSDFNRSISKWMLLLSYRRNIPLIGFSRRYVEAGATAALFSSPESIANDTAFRLEQWQQQGGGALSPPSYPIFFDLDLNRQAAEKIGLTLPLIQDVRAAVAGGTQP
ncbi:MAG: hypothetical protein V7707_06200 [Motiliproteus sp.]